MEKNKVKKETSLKKIAKDKAKTPTAAKEKTTAVTGKKPIEPWDTILYPHMAEKSMALVDLQNKLVFVVKRTSSKKQIKQAFEKLFDVKVSSIKTETTNIGQKKAFIKLDPKYSAADIATKMGIL